MLDPSEKKGYLGNTNLKRCGEVVEFTKEDVEEYVKCSNDPVYFIENYVRIVTIDHGLQPFKLYDYQKRMVESFHKNRFTICKTSRQAGKSTTVVAFFVWYILFNESKNLAILANNQTTAKEMMDRLKLAYEHLPKFLQQGVSKWNELSIKLENGCSVFAGPTSSDSVRGRTFSLILLDEFAFVPSNVATEFFRSVFPVISSGQSSKVIVVSTPNGMNMFYALWTDAVAGNNDYCPIEVKWRDVPGRDEAWKQSQIRNSPGKERDFIQEHEVEFVGGLDTLISSEKLRSMRPSVPEFDNGTNLQVYHKPKEGRTYVIVADTGHGVGQDYSAFLVMDATEMPYTIAAKFRDNTIAPMVYPNAIESVAKSYNEALVLVELNDIGEQTANLLYYDLEYTNLMMVSTNKRGGHVLGEGFGGSNVQMGIRTTKSVKRSGCGVLKGLIEEDKMIVNDMDVISELASFIAKGNSYEAQSGSNDDLAMCLVLFAWAISQEYFRDLMDIDIRKEMYRRQLEAIEESVVPPGFFDPGAFGQSDNDGWEPVPGAM